MSERGLVLSGLSVELAGRSIVAEASLSLGPATFAVILGPNGAGKTSLLRAIVGLIPSRGAMRLDGRDLRSLSPGQRARHLAYLPQGHAAHWPLPARHIVALGRFPHGAKDPERMSASDSEAVDDAMRITQTLEFAERPITMLSGGERARVALARVFAVGAPVILADEPTAALDPRHQIDVAKALSDRAKAGALVVAVTHDLGLAARFADIVIVMASGRIAASGPPGEVLSPDLLREVFAVEAYRSVHSGEPVLVPWA